jgi:hypothetical protein
MDITGQITQAGDESETGERKKGGGGGREDLASYLVRMILMRRSQLQPVMANTAAGGKIMATMMRTTSEPLTMVSVFCGPNCAIQS